MLPSDPGLKISVREAQIEEFDTISKSIFGTTMLDRKTGKPIEYQQHVFTGRATSSAWKACRFFISLI